MDPVTAASSFSAGRFEPANDDALDRLLAGFCLPAGVSARLSDRFRAEAAAAGAPESAAERAEAALTAWFAEVLGAPERALSRGRAAFLIVGGPHHFADRLLVHPVPAGLAAALRRACPVPVPGPAPRTMPEQSLGFAPAPIAQPGAAAQQAGHPATVGNAPLRGRG